MEGSGGGEAPFDAPASACGLVCLLLLLEGAASSKQLFGGGSYGPSFAVQTLGVRLLHDRSHMLLCVRGHDVIGLTHGHVHVNASTSSKDCYSCTHSSVCTLDTELSLASILKGIG